MNKLKKIRARHAGTVTLGKETKLYHRCITSDFTDPKSLAIEPNGIYEQFIPKIDSKGHTVHLEFKDGDHVWDGDVMAAFYIEQRTA